jgi:hypothetical protein
MPPTGGPDDPISLALPTPSGLADFLAAGPEGMAALTEASFAPPSPDGTKYPLADLKPFDGRLPPDIEAELRLVGADPERLGDARVTALIEQLAIIEREIPALPIAPRAKLLLMEAEFLSAKTTIWYRDLGQKYGYSRTTVEKRAFERKWGVRRRILRDIFFLTRPKGVIPEGAPIVALPKPPPLPPRPPQPTPLEGAAPAERPARAAKMRPRDQKQEEADQELRLLQMADNALKVWDEALKSGQIVFRSAKDLDTLVRLVAFIQGRAERIVEQRHRVTPEDYERIVRAVARRHSYTPERIGLVRDAEFTEVAPSRAPADAPVGLQAQPTATQVPTPQPFAPSTSRRRVRLRMVDVPDPVPA